MESKTFFFALYLTGVKTVKASPERVRHAVILSVRLEEGPAHESTNQPKAAVLQG